MTWGRVPPPKPTPPGDWEHFSYGSDYKGWVLRCGPAFHAQITGGGNQYYTMFNSQSLQVQQSLPRAQAAVEEKIVNDVRAMLPAYRVIFDRVERRGVITAAHANVTPIHGNKE
jgi:hypothetical protein